MARTLAALLGTLCLLNVIVSICSGSFNANLWWIDLRFLPGPLATLIEIAAAVSLLWIAVGRTPRWLVLGRVRLTLIGLILVTFINGLVFYLAVYHHAVLTLCPIPFSWIVTGVLVAILRSTFGPPKPVRLRTALLATLIAAVGFPLAQMMLFGTTDYARAADVIVVFGARTYADGEPSEALADRVRTGCDLYHRGLAPRIIFSGGPGDGAIDEPHAMQTLAISLGVPASDIVLDSLGLNTAATVRNTAGASGRASPSVLAVSHFYHLPRVKLCYEQAGVEVFTVPAHQRRILSQLPKLMVREVAALWVYYARGIA